MANGREQSRQNRHQHGRTICSVLDFQSALPGDLTHIDVKLLARFHRIGHCITGNRQQGRSTGVGYDRIQVAIDDTTRLAYVEVLPDEQHATAIGFLSRAVAWFNGQGVECRQVMTYNGHAYVSCSFAKACGAHGLKHIRTRPYTSRANSKAERFIQKRHPPLAIQPFQELRALSLLQ